MTHNTQDGAEKFPTFRNRRKARFTQVGNTALLDSRLSLGAKGLLTLMLSRPDDWTYHMSWLAKQSTDSMYALRKTIRELLDAGYVIRTAKRGERGRVCGWEYAVSDDPADLTDFTNYRKTVGPTYGESHTTKTDSFTKTDLDQEKDGAEPRRAGEGGGEAQAAHPHLPPVRESGQAERKAGRQNPPTALKKVPRGAAAVEFPPELAAHSGWEEAWGEWLAYRRERKLTCTPATLRGQLKKLAAMPDPLAVIEQSITQGWAGLFDLKGPGKPRTQADANARAAQTAQDVYRAITEEPDNVPF